MKKPRATDPTAYQMNVVTFSVVREPGAATRRRVSEPADAVALVRELIVDDAKEHFWILMLTTQNTLIATHEVSVGTLSASLVTPREVFAPALRIMGAASIILAHNHPSGDATPSAEDLKLTKRLTECAAILELRIHDHIIIGNGTDSYASLAERGQLMTTFLGGDKEGVNWFRIVTLRGAVQLEARYAAMPGKPKPFPRSMTEQARKELGLPKGTKREAILAALDVAVAAQREITIEGRDVIR
jgi:DNA repair protein RadC